MELCKTNLIAEANESSALSRLADADTMATNLLIGTPRTSICFLSAVNTEPSTGAYTSKIQILNKFK